MAKHRAGLALIGLALLTGGSTTQAGGRMDNLSGYWSGFGSVTLANGSVEQLKCVATYRIGGEQLRQNLRCASAGYSINASADLLVKGQDVSGNWEEKTYAAVGSVSGRMVDDGFTLSIQGANFTAAMSVTTTSCKQSINISPRGLDVTKISIGLGKC